MIEIGACQEESNARRGCENERRSRSTADGAKSFREGETRSSEQRVPNGLLGPRCPQAGGGMRLRTWRGSPASSPP